MTSGNLRLVLIALILVAILLAASLILPRLLKRSPPNQNELILGSSSPVSELDLLIRPPLELDFMTKSEVLQLRLNVVYGYPELFRGEYSPSQAVFGQIIDGLPWWGMAGQFYYGEGDRSIEGPSEESRFILNPFLLIAVDPYIFWENLGVTEAQVQQPGFRFYCEPERLRWQPQASYAEVVYSAECARQLGYRYFDLISYNARDFNLNYIYVSYPDSRNVSKDAIPSDPFAIPHYLHQGGSCGYPGGCNNMSPPSPPIDALELTGVPAKIVVWLWEQAPESLEIPPDFVYLILFQ